MKILPLTSRVYGTIHLIDTDIFDRVRDSVHGNFSDYKRTIGEVSAKGQLYIVNLVLHVGLRRIDHYRFVLIDLETSLRSVSKSIRTHLYVFYPILIMYPHLYRN